MSEPENNPIYENKKFRRFNFSQYIDWLKQNFLILKSYNILRQVYVSTKYDRTESRTGEPRKATEKRKKHNQSKY